MGDALALGFWNILIFIADFLAKAIVAAWATVLLGRAGIAALAMVAVAALAFLIVRRRR